MSSFTCEHCGTDIIDTPEGYITECEHYPKEKWDGRYTVPEDNWEYFYWHERKEG